MLRDTEFMTYFDKDILRQEQLLQILIREDRWYQLDELSNELCWGKKTISNDLILLNNYLPNEWSILTAKGRGIRLNKPIDSSLTSILYLIRKKNTAYKIFKHLLHSNCTSVLSLSKKLNVSYSTTRDILKKMGIHLKKYRLKLEYSPLQIHGREDALRTFIVRFYLNIYEQHWPFSNYNQRNIRNFLSYFEKKMGIHLFQADKHALSVYLCIMVNRIKLRKFINTSKKDLAFLQETTFYESFTTVIPYIEKEHAITVTNMEATYFIHHLIGAQYCYNNVTHTKPLMLKRVRNGTTNIYYTVRTFVKNLETRTGISLLYDDEFLFQLSLCFRRTLYKLRIFPLDFIQSSPNIFADSSLIKMIKHQYTATFKFVLEEYELFFKKNIEGNKDNIFEEEVAIITLYIESNKIVQETKPIQVFLYVAENQGLYRFTSTWLRRFFPEKIKILPYSAALNKKELESDNCQLILTNTNITFTTSLPIIQISKLPNKRDKEIIDRYLTNL